MNQKGLKAKKRYRILYCKNIHRREYCFNKCNDDIKKTHRLLLRTSCLIVFVKRQRVLIFLYNNVNTYIYNIANYANFSIILSPFLVVNIFS